MFSKTETKFTIYSRIAGGFSTIAWEVNEAADENQRKYKLTLSAIDTDEVFESLADGKYKVLFTLGVVNYEDSRIKFNISGRRKVAKVIDQICADSNYQNALNKAVINALKEFRQSLPTKQVIIPAEGKQYQSFKVNPSGNTLSFTHNPTHTVQRMLSEENIPQVFKQDNYGRINIELEVYTAFCMNILLPTQTPPMHTVYNSKTERMGNVSQEIEGFKSLDYLRQQRKLPSQQELVRGGIGRIFAVNHTEENNDANLNNLGFLQRTKQVVMIDFDRATWSITKKYFVTKYDSNHLELFVISASNIDNFPYLAAPRPDCWATDIYANWRKFDQFVNDAYFIFLKRALLDETVFRAIADATLTKLKLADEVVALKVKRTVDLKAALVQSQNFRQFMRTAPDLEKRLVEEFIIYNNQYQPNNPLKIDIERMQRNLHDIQALFKQHHKTPIVSETPIASVLNLRLCLNPQIAAPLPEQDEESKQIASKFNTLKKRERGNFFQDFKPEELVNKIPLILPELFAKNKYPFLKLFNNWELIKNSIKTVVQLKVYLISLEQKFISKYDNLLWMTNLIVDVDALIDVLRCLPKRERLNLAIKLNYKPRNYQEISKLINFLKNNKNSGKSWTTFSQQLFEASQPDDWFKFLKKKNQWEIMTALITTPAQLLQAVTKMNRVNRLVFIKKLTSEEDRIKGFINNVDTFKAIFNLIPPSQHFFILHWAKKRLEDHVWKPIQQQRQEQLEIEEKQYELEQQKLEFAEQKTELFNSNAPAFFSMAKSNSLEKIAAVKPQPQYEG